MKYSSELENKNKEETDLGIHNREKEEKKGQEELDQLIEEELTRQRLIPSKGLDSSFEESTEHESWKFASSEDKNKNLDWGQAPRETLNFSTNDLTRFLKSPPLSSVKAPFRWEKKADLGKGTFGNIYSAENLSNNSLVFVKEVKIFSNDPELEEKKDTIRALMVTIDGIKAFNHENIVPYLGYELGKLIHCYYSR